MNIFELAFIALLVTVVVLGSRALGAALGVSAWIAALPVAAVVVLLLRALRRYLVRTSLPSCVDGRCGPEDYEHEMSPAGELLLRCRCQRVYRMSRGRFFQLIDEVGVAHPYMERRCLLGRWRQDPKCQMRDLAPGGGGNG